MVIEVDLEELMEEVKEKQTKKRFRHTLGVMNTSACLAMRYEVDINSAQIAGLLHDVAKCITDDKMISKCKKAGLNISKFEQNNPYLLHGRLGAYYAKNKYNIKDEDILNAIRYHTTGRENMSMLEKIVFMADYIEPSRKLISQLDEIRKISFIDIDMAVFMTLENTLNHLKGSKKETDETTVCAYNYYKNLISIR